jgi:hypothetical protein
VVVVVAGLVLDVVSAVVGGMVVEVVEVVVGGVVAGAVAGVLRRVAVAAGRDVSDSVAVSSPEHAVAITANKLMAVSHPRRRIRASWQAGGILRGHAVAGGPGEPGWFVAQRT